MLCGVRMWREPDGALGDGTKVLYDDGPASPARMAGLIAGGLLLDGTVDVNALAGDAYPVAE
jgi:hypothetical protein